MAHIEGKEVQSLINALKFYANGGHFSFVSTGVAPSVLAASSITIIDKGEVATEALDNWYEFLGFENPGGEPA